jgi:hypothetical protein
MDDGSGIVANKNVPQLDRQAFVDEDAQTTPRI